MPKTGYRKDIVSMRGNIGSTFLVMPALPVWSVWSWADNHRVSHEGSSKPLDLSMHLYVSHDRVIIHYQPFSVALLSLDDTWKQVIVTDPCRASSLLTSSKENRIA